MQEKVERKEILITQNRKASHLYEIVQRMEAGIVLKGTEVKSLRQSKCSIVDSYATFPNKNNNDLYLVNFHINPFEQGNRNNHEPKRQRRLLVNAREAVKLRTGIQEKGLTLIPLSVYFSGPFVKIEIALVRIIKKADKREHNIEKETKKDIHKRFRYN